MNTQAILVQDANEKPSSDFAKLKPRLVQTAEDLLSAFKEVKRALWIARDPEFLRQLVTLAPGERTSSRLLLLEEVSGYRAAFLRAYFATVVAPDPQIRLVSSEVLAEILADDAPQDYFIGGVYVPEDDVLVLYRGDLETVVVPLSWFDRPVGPKPAPEDFEIIDYGQSVRLGEFEAATDAILYGFDADFRRRARQREVQEDHSFGGSLRRLRLEKGVNQNDFPEISARTIRRIENGTVTRPHRDTVEKIARRLDVKPDEIESW